MPSFSIRRKRRRKLSSVARSSSLNPPTTISDFNLPGWRCASASAIEPPSEEPSTWIGPKASLSIMAAKSAAQASTGYEGGVVDEGGNVVGPGVYGVGRRRLGRAADAARVDRQHLQMPRQERNAKTVIAMIQPQAADQQERLPPARCRAVDGG